MDQTITNDVFSRRMRTLETINFEDHDRRTSIGGSEVSAALGLNNFKTKLQLWAEKSGKVIEKDISNLPAVISGNLLEPVILKMFLDRMGFDAADFATEAVTFRHPLLQWMTFSPDAHALDGSFGIEIKNVGYRMMGAWGTEGTDEIPTPYLLQVAFGSIVTRIPVWYIVAQMGTEQRVYKYVKNIRLEKNLLRKVRRFWKYNVLGGNAPAATEDDTENVKALFWKKPTKIRPAKGNEIDLLYKYSQIRPAFLALEKMKERLENQLRFEIGDSEGITDGEFTATWKGDKGRRFGWKKPTKGK